MFTTTNQIFFPLIYAVAFPFSASSGYSVYHCCFRCFGSNAFFPLSLLLKDYMYSWYYKKCSFFFFSPWLIFSYWFPYADVSDGQCWLKRFLSGRTRHSHRGSGSVFWLPNKQLKQLNSSWNSSALTHLSAPSVHAADQFAGQGMKICLKMVLTTVVRSAWSLQWCGPSTEASLVCGVGCSLITGIKKGILYHFTLFYTISTFAGFQIYCNFMEKRLR